MKKILLLFLFGIFLLNFISAEIQPVYYKFTLEYKPSCISQYFNITDSQNNTIQNNVTRCSGTIELLGVEENFLTIIEEVNSTAWKRIFAGFKNVELGNETDITGIMDRLDEYDKLYNQLEICKESNSNISTAYYSLSNDVGYKENFTACDLERTTLQSQKDSQTSQLNLKEEEIKKLNSNKWFYGIIGIALGFLIFSQGLPYLKGMRTPKDESESQHPQYTQY